MTSISDDRLMLNPSAQTETITRLSKNYPFVELIYSLDSDGVQLMDTVYSPYVSNRKYREPGKGRDRSHRPYVVTARNSSDKVIVTEPYLSSATHQLVISSAQAFPITTATTKVI
ncbi:MAG: hypothetical protein V7752_14465 [Halopseudomonas sp.]